MTASTARILLADDDPVILLVIRAALETSGFTVITAVDGHEAVRRFQSDSPDCIILDVMMPGLDGFEACRTIRALPGGKEVPILVLTSLEDVAAVSQAYESGATDFAAKGLSNRLLHERVRFLLRAYNARLALHQSRSRLRAVQDMAKVGHWEIAPDGKTIDVARIVTKILGANSEALDHIDGLRAALTAPTTERFDECLASWRLDHSPFQLDGRCKNAAYIYIQGATTSTGRADDGSSLTLALQDVTAVRQAQHHARRFAHFDVVTGLPNKRRFIQQLTTAIEERAPSATIAVLAISVRGHERLTQSAGVAADDQARVAISRVLRSVAGPEGQAVCSLSFLEAGIFAIALPMEESTSTPVEFCQRAVNALATPISGPGWLLAVDSHVGIAVWPQNGLTADELLANAQATAARLAAESADRYGFFTAEIHARARRRLQLESDLHTALQRCELKLLYQPRVELGDLHVCGAEALMRWHHPTLGVVSPADFIPIAEESGLIEEIGRWALREACRQTTVWRQQFGRAITISVNVSARQLRIPKELAEAVRAALDEYGLPASTLELELTESMVLHAGPSVLAALNDLRSAGVSIALDDFGTGYSSLGHLRKLPVDCLKIDQSFVSDLTTDTSALDVLDAILAIASALRLRTVAEGVETVEQFRLLCKHGCREAQGFLFAKPLAASDFQALLSDPNALRLLPMLAATA